MIEELKSLLDALANTPNMALYGLGLFITWKLVIYLSTAGSIVYVCKLSINKLHDYKTRVNEFIPPPPPDPPPVEYKFGGRLIGGEGTKELLSDVLRRLTKHLNPNSPYGYLHQSDIQWLQDVLEAAIKAEKEK